MLVFIDESGDTGFKLDRGSSSHFVIACVIFDDNLDAEETALAIKRFRRSLNRRDDHEFKFNKCNEEIRAEFFKAVSKCKFRVRAVVVDKSKLTSASLKGDKKRFHNYFIKAVLEQSSGTIREAGIRIDGEGEREYKRAAAAYFRRELNSDTRIVKNVRFVNSQGDSLIQLADMVAGALRRSCSGGASPESGHLAHIATKLQDVWHFRSRT